jgi:5-methylcytosine-specific restriction endonuclease McrA
MFKHDMPSRVEGKRIRKAEDMAAWRAVCKQVDARDKGRCRVCGRRCDPNAVGMLERAERHHIEYRSRGGEDIDHNVVTMCSGCHTDQHAGRIDVRGNARAGIEIWRPDDGGTWFLARREQMAGVWERD